jgi:drug/metabolite transporter (DMT)-like permease
MSAGLWLALAASLGFATLDGLRKHLVQHLSPITTAALMNGAQAVILLSAALLEHGGVPHAPPAFYAIVLVTAVINLITTLMYLRAVQRSPLSLTIPYLAFTPALLLLTAWVVLGELPSVRGACGVLLVTLGAFVLPGVRTWRAPLAALAREPGSRLMLGVALIWAVSSALDKRAVGWASPTYYGGLVFGLSAVATLGYTVLYQRAELRAARAQWPWLTAAAVGSAGALWAQYASYATLPVSYTIAIKRAGMLGSVLIGWRFFGEGELGPRLVGASIMLAGVLLIVLSPA